MSPPSSWEQIAAAKRKVRDAKIPPAWRLPNTNAKPNTSGSALNVTDVPRTCGILTPREVEITETPATALVARMLARDLLSEEVTTAFCKRAAIAHQLTNCLTEIFFDEGIAAARAIDAAYAQTGKPQGRLHGLPISLKDNINVPGVDSSVGFVAWCNKPTESDGDLYLYNVLRNAGAVLFCKTNVPTGMLMAETYNNIWGYTSNPYNTEYLAGGSSGGEAALLALRGAPLGVGSDIAGSIRMPSALCGLYGLKSSGGRFSLMGGKSGQPGQESLKAVVGPMSADLSSLQLWAEAVLGVCPWEADPNVTKQPWRVVEVPQKLCFGIIMDDGIVKPTPAVTRVLRETKAALEAAGHRVVEWTPFGADVSFDLIQRFLRGDGGHAMASIVAEGHEPWPRGLKMFQRAYDASKDSPATVAALWKLQTERFGYLRNLLQAIADTENVSGTGRPFDGIISPVVAFPSAPRYAFQHIGYASFWNLADVSSVAFPAGHAKRSDVKKGDETFRNRQEEAVWRKYDPVRVDGMPVGLQMVVPRHEDERAIKLTGVAVDALMAYRNKPKSVHWAKL